MSRTAGAIALVALIAVACSDASSSSDAAPSRASSDQRTTTTSAAARIAPTADQAALVAERPFAVHKPPSGAPSNAPLLILLHGYGVTGELQEAYLRLTPAADANRMLLVVLDGTKDPSGRQFWNATDACCDRFDSGVDDAAYITAVIADVTSRYAVDPSRVFLVGHSNGGFMSFRMACDHADRVAAIVSIAGATWSDADRCAPSEPVATLQVHGVDDETIAYDGGNFGNADYPGALTTLETWARHDGCPRKPDPPDPATRTIVADLPPATVRAYSTGCARNGHAELWTQPEGGHIPPFSEAFAEQIVGFLMEHPKA